VTGTLFLSLHKSAINNLQWFIAARSGQAPHSLSGNYRLTIADWRFEMSVG
jgi:hypothetical protein